MRAYSSAQLPVGVAYTMTVWFRVHKSPLAKCVVCLSSVLCFIATSFPVYATTNQSLRPIHIEADHFEVRFDEDIAIWQGKVTATQGNYTFRTAQLKIHLDQVDQNAGTQEHRQTEDGKALPDHFYLSAQELTYDLGNEAITGSGDSELRRGQELIRADTITYWVAKRLAVAIPNGDGRVTVQFYPNPQQPIFPGSNPRGIANTSKTSENAATLLAAQ